MNVLSVVSLILQYVQSTIKLITWEGDTVSIQKRRLKKQDLVCLQDNEQWS